MRKRTSVAIVGMMVWALVQSVGAASVPGDPWADQVVSYQPGATPVSGFTDPLTALGSPERFTGEGAFPGVVSMFNPAFGTDEIVSVGEGGHLTISFDSAITDAPGHLFGADFIVFGNSGFIDTAFPAGQQGNPASMFGIGLATIEVSADGVNFIPVPTLADTLFPTQGYLDAGPFDSAAGSIPTNFTRPVDPALTLSDFDGLTFSESLALYDGSGGGTPVDIAASGLASVSFVRISMADDGDSNTALHAEIDAFSVVPEPASALLLIIGAVALRRRSRLSRGSGVLPEKSWTT